MNFRSNILIKKAWRHGASVPRCWHRIAATPDTYRELPPVLVNSFPKSGTHLLVQVIGVLPRMRDWGDFWASQPSFTFREQDGETLAGRISRVAPGELVCGHLYYGEEVARSLAERSVAHFYIHRDPRDVVVSEAYYLAEMNRWHRLHRHFRKLPTHKERILLAIRGLRDDNIQYPDIGKRFARFSGWLGRPDVCLVTYEELTSERRDEALKRIFDFYARHVGAELDLSTLVEQAALAIQPTRSHTFRRGGSGGWRREFDDRLKEAFKEVAGDLLIDLGYEESLGW